MEGTYVFKNFTYYYCSGDTILMKLSGRNVSVRLPVNTMHDHSDILQSDT